MVAPFTLESKTTDLYRQTVKPVAKRSSNCFLSTCGERLRSSQTPTLAKCLKAKASNCLQSSLRPKPHTFPVDF